MSQHRTSTGFALIDALVALLLFAVVLLAAIATLLSSMHATHQAVLTGRAVDLAADFLEERRALPAGAAGDSLLDAWNERVQSELPAAARDTASRLVQPLLAAAVAATP